MRRVDHLIRQIRRQTDNEQHGLDSGISDEEFVQYLNDAQDDLQTAIIQTHRKSFAKVAYIDVQAGVAEYTLPFDVWADGSIICAEFTYSGNAKDYYSLQRSELCETIFVTGQPRYYSIRRNIIRLSPVPSTAIGMGIRLTYNERLPLLDKPRGVVKTVTVVGNDITVLTLDTTSPYFNHDDWLEDAWMSVVDKFGNIQTYAISYADVSLAGVVTFIATKTLGTGEHIAIGNLVTRGFRATTHSQLSSNPGSDAVERYLLAYGAWKIFKRDSSKDSTEQEAEQLAAIKNAIVGMYGQLHADVDRIPKITSEFEEYD